MSTSAAVIASVAVETTQPWHRTAPPAGAIVRDFVMPAATTSRGVTLEQEAYERGRADGHRQATESAAPGVAAMIARLSSAIQEIADLRTGFLKRSEQDVVRLALEVAKRVLQREASSDPSLLLEIARRAVEKVATGRLVTIEMHPDGLAAVTAEARSETEGPIDLVANPRLAPGACVVQSTAGAVDVSIDAQIQELLDTLLRDDAAR